MRKRLFDGQHRGTKRSHWVNPMGFLHEFDRERLFSLE
jgi:hypothetical protein